MLLSSLRYRITSSFLPALILGAVLAASYGCQKNRQPIAKEQVAGLTRSSVKQLEKRIEKIELQIKKNIPAQRRNDMKTPTGPIKSLTFRIGTEDDRLRIYWADGSNSDLPCTKEQAIWVCG